MDMTNVNPHEGELTVKKWFQNVWLGLSSAIKGIAITFKYVY